LAEQLDDVARLAQLKELARLADERWANKPIAPNVGQGKPSPLVNAKHGECSKPSIATESRQVEEVRDERKEWQDSKPGERIEKINDPWKIARSGIKENWAPESWDPNARSAQH